MTRPSTPPPWLINAVIVVVVIAWAANLVARTAVHNYDPPEGLDALMLAVVGFLLAGRQAGRDLPPPDESDDDEDEGAAR